MIVYLTHTYPNYSTTFTRAELDRLDVEPWSLRRPPREFLTGELEDEIERTRYVRPQGLGRIIAANVRAALGRRAARWWPAALDLVWSSFSGPLFYAALELWVAARTDPELHANLYTVERRVGRAMVQLFQELSGERSGSNSRFEDVLELTFYTIRGMALQRILRDDDTERRRLFELWKKMVSDALLDPAN